MRVGFTILYEGLHHLKHQGFADFMAKNFDYWIVIEGLAGNGGSTGWCKALPLPGRSRDGCHEFMESFSKQHTNVIYYSPGEKWESKDAMVNEAVKIVKLITDSCLLWQVDADEIWTLEKLKAAEKQFSASSAIAGAFQFHHYLCKTVDGRQLIGRGEWGEGYNTRLWKWSGQKFITHEPPRLAGQADVVPLSQMYEHYSYYFEKDVLFKSRYYSGHEYVFRGWSQLRTYTGPLPLPFTSLFGTSKKFNRNKSFIDELKSIPSCQKQDAAVSQGQEAA